MAEVVRRMLEADIPAAVAVQLEAFGGEPADAIRRYEEGPRYTWRNAWVVEVDGEIGAVAIAIQATWCFRGARLPVSAVAGVAVRPVDRRRGFASRLVNAILDDDRASGRSVSMLYPFQHGFYRRLGYATVGLTHFYELPTERMPDEPRLRRCVRPLRETDRDSVQRLFSDYLKHGAGGLERSDARWQGRWKNQDERWVVFEDGTGGPSGYLAYRTDGQRLDVREFVTLRPEAERGLWAFLAAQVEQRRSIRYHTPADRPLWAMLSEPAMYEGANRGFIFNDAAALTTSLMARLVDVPAALSAAHFPPDIRATWTMSIDDAQMGPEPITIKVTLAGGRARAEPHAEPRKDVECDVGTLTQLFCGVLRASDAHWFGRLRADGATLELLDRAFAGPRPFIHPADWF